MKTRIYVAPAVKGLIRNLVKEDAEDKRKASKPGKPRVT